MDLKDFKLGKYYFCIMRTEPHRPEIQGNNEFSWTITYARCDAKGVMLENGAPQAFIEILGNQRIKPEHAFDTLEDCLELAKEQAMQVTNQVPEVLPQTP